MTIRFGLLALVVALLLSGCAGKSRAGDGGSSMGGAGTAGGPPGTGGSSGAAGAVPDLFETVDWGEPYTRFDEPGPDETVDCRAVELTGTLDGEPIDHRYALNSRGWLNGTSWFYAARLPAWGRAELFGESVDAIDFERLPTGSTLSAHKARLTLPRFLPRPERPVCAVGPHSLVRGTNHYALNFLRVGRLSSCEDAAPVDASLDLCMGESCHSLVGVLEGIALDTNLRVHDANPEYAEVSTETLWLRVYYRATGPLTADVAEGIVRDEATGAVYCVSESSRVYAEPEDGGSWHGYRRRIELRGLRRLGDCNEIAAPDSLSVRVCTPLPPPP